MIKITSLYIVSAVLLVCFVLYSCLSLNYFFDAIFEGNIQKFNAEFLKRSKGDSLLFLGDIMFDRGIAAHIAKYGQDSLFRNVQSVMDRSDLVIGNLEGTVTSYPSVSQKNNKILRFTFDPGTIDILKKSKIGIVSLANNHSFDFGSYGYEQTLENLNQSGIQSFGSARNDRNLSTKVFLNGKSYCFIGYHDLFTFDPEPVSNEISFMRNQCNKIIVFTHWGEEYNTFITNRQRMLAHEFIDSGADIVIGSHPHVVEPIEMYKNKAIFYSLGNFIFDQKLSFETEHGLMVRINFFAKDISFDLIPTSIINREVYVATSTDANITLSTLSKDDSLPQEIKRSILSSGKF